MPQTPSWSDIAIRIILALAAGTLFGLNRNERARPAGLRTTLLVCLAACVSMVQVNLLLSLAGKASDSFVVLDLMRLPLGVLSGMGFIGAGAILRRDDAVQGVTTAATLWFVTILGLCFGGGQLRLGAAATGIGILVLGGLVRVEQMLPRLQKARLTVATYLSADEGIPEEEIRRVTHENGFLIARCTVTLNRVENRRCLDCLVRWRGRQTDAERTPPLLERLGSDSRVLQIEWTPDVGA
jgi:putative Mg2+ transporter-C (MgtC) family protein